MRRVKLKLLADKGINERFFKRQRTFKNLGIIKQLISAGISVLVADMHYTVIKKIMLFLLVFCIIIIEIAT